MRRPIYLLITIVLVIITLMLTLTACNQQLLDTKWNFKKAHLIEGNQVTEIAIRSWKDYDDSDVVQITDANGITYLTHYSNIVLISK